MREEVLATHSTSGSQNRRRFAQRVAGAAGAAALSGAFPRIAAAQGARTLNGAGATFPAVLYSRWAEEFFRASGIRVNYQSIGSGGGIKAHQDMTADFGATDAPMTEQQLAEAKGGPTLHIPMVLGAVVPTYNLPGITQPLRFTGEALANIFLGNITTWNDPAIAAENPGVNLPAANITTVHRSDGSGTTFTFVDFLSKVSPVWQSQVGASTTVNWPGGLGGRGNEGVAGEVRQNPNSIGYVELAYAVQNRLGVGRVRNAAGALETMPDDLRVSITNAAGAESWPISTFTWILAYRQQRDRAKGQALTEFLYWGITEGQRFAADLFYAPLPKAVLPLTFSKIQSINTQGQALLNPAHQLPAEALSREVVSTVDNGDGTATTTYADGTSETYPIG